MNIVDLVPNLRLPSKQLYDIFTRMLLDSGFSIISIFDNIQLGAKSYEISNDNNKYLIHIKLKNVSYCGWKNRLEVRRIQTKPLVNIPKIEGNKCFLLGGISFYDKVPILVVWYAQEYAYHQSNRSCYVNVSSIKKAYDHGYHCGINMNQIVYLCRSDKFDLLLNDYINKYYVEDLHW